VERLDPNIEAWHNVRWIKISHLHDDHLEAVPRSRVKSPILVRRFSLGGENRVTLTLTNEELVAVQRATLMRV